MEEINQSELMGKKYKKVYRVLDYNEHLFILISTVSGCVFVGAFASLVGITIGITSSAIALKICVISGGIKKCKSIIKKKKKHDKILLLASCKLNSIEVLISKALFDSNISQNLFIPIINMTKECDGIKEEIKNSNENWKFKKYIKQSYLIAWSVEKIQKVKTQTS